MGMSGDFEVAIEEGATMVRVGTAIFGPRPPRPSPGRSAMSVKGKTRRLHRRRQHGRGADQGPRWSRASCPASAIHATDVRAERLSELTAQYGIRARPTTPRVVRQADVVILAVKPQIMDAVLGEIAPRRRRAARS